MAPLRIDDLTVIPKQYYKVAAHVVACQRRNARSKWQVWFVGMEGKRCLAELSRGRKATVVGLGPLIAATFRSMQPRNPSSAKWMEPFGPSTCPAFTNSIPMVPNPGAKQAVQEAKYIATTVLPCAFAASVVGLTDADCVMLHETLQVRPRRIKIPSKRTSRLRHGMSTTFTRPAELPHDQLSPVRRVFSSHRACHALARASCMHVPYEGRVEMSSSYQP